MKTYLIFLPLLLAAGCGLPGFGTGPTLTKRHRKHATTCKDHIVALKVAANKPPAPAATPPIVLQLSDHGQAAFVALAAGDPKNLASALGKTFPSPPRTTDSRTRVRTTLVLTHGVDRDVRLTKALEHLEPRPPSDADRIAALEIELTLEGPVSFDGFNRFTTVYGEVALGEVTQTSSRTFNASLNPTLTGSIAGSGEIGGSSTTSTAEKVVLKERIIQLSGFLDKNMGTILLEGGVGLDLEGNTSVDVVLELNGKEVPMLKLEGLFKQGIPQAAKNLKPRFIKTKIPAERTTEDITINAKSNYRFRHVRNGIETVSESDDVVLEYRGRSRGASTTVLSKASLEERSQYYLINLGEDHLRLSRGMEDEEVHFGTRAEAYDFLRWVNSSTLSGATPTEIGEGADAWILEVNGTVLDSTMVKDLMVKSNFKPDEGEKDERGINDKGVDQGKPLFIDAVEAF